MEPLNLSVPRQHTYTDPTVERNVKRLREWLTGLPLMEVVETLRLMHGALDSSNEQMMDDQLRFDSLEAFHSTIQRLFVTIDPLKLRQLKLSDTQREQAVAGIEKLLISLSGGYKLIVISQQSSGKPGPLLGLAVNRAIETLVYTLLDCFRFYRATQPCYFSEMHQLYSAARYHGLLNVKTVDKEQGYAATTAALYHAGMLIGLMDPYRLADGEISLLFELLSKYSGSCRVIPGNCQPGETEGRFQIDLGGDAAPKSCAKVDASSVAANPYVLDVSNMLEAVNTQMQKIPEKVRMLSPESIMIRQLGTDVSEARKRSEARKSTTRAVQLLRGISSIHNFLARPSLKQVLGQAARGKNQSMLKPYQCQVLDSSESGMRLSWLNDEGSDVRVSDLVAIVEGQSGQEYLKLAIIRSVQVYRQGAMDAGVMLIQGAVGAVSCYFTGDKAGTGSEALFLTSDNDEHGAPTLIAAKGVYEDGRRLTVDLEDGQIRVHAGRLVFSGTVFDRFEFMSE